MYVYLAATLDAPIATVFNYLSKSRVQPYLSVTANTVYRFGFGVAVLQVKTYV